MHLARADPRTGARRSRRAGAPAALCTSG